MLVYASTAVVWLHALTRVLHRVCGLPTRSPYPAHNAAARPAPRTPPPQPWARLEVTALPAMALRPGEGRGAFVQRVQEDIARELGSYVVPGFSVSHKRALATGGTGESGGGARRRRARGGGA